MPYRCLADFLEDLNHAGELNRVDDEVDPAGELASRASDAARSGGPAVLFSAVKGSHLPVLCDLLADERRICRALGIAAIDELAERIARLLDVSAPEGWFERLKGAARPAALGNLAPREVKSAPCQQIVRLGGDVRLDELPWIGPAPAKGTVPLSLVRKLGQSPSIGGAAVFSADPDTHRLVCGRFDLHRRDGASLAVHWAPHDEHARLAAEYRARNQKMPLAAAIGGDPAFLLAVAAPLPTEADVCAVAGLLRGKPLDVVACRGVDLTVPAETEIVLEGFLDADGDSPDFRTSENGTVPFASNLPIMRVTALTHRANPIFTTAVPSDPPNEACTMARAMQRAFLPLTRLAMPELVDYDMPEFAAARGWAVAAIRKTYAGQGRRAAHAAWGLRSMMFAKVLIVVDADVDVHDQTAVLAAVAANMNPSRDVIFEQGPADPLYAASSGPLSQKMAIDATRKLPGED